MDPNVTLARLRELASKPNYPVALDEAWDDITELFEALDGWLSRGGSLPSAWEANRNG